MFTEQPAFSVIKGTEATALMRYLAEMIDLYFSLTSLAFVVVATLSAVASTSASPITRSIACTTVNGSTAFALISASLAVWFLIQPPT
jgi:hypothetical protein